MLVEITIRDFAIIESLRIEFGRGLNVLTGETGTGKSIVVDAVDLLLGSRASSDMVRTGCSRAVIEGVFDISGRSDDALGLLLAEQGLTEGETALILSREISAEGRSLGRVNGHTVPNSMLSEIGRYLIDVHGQSEHLSLLREKHHVALLDRYAGLDEEREQFAALAGRLRAVRRQAAELAEAARDRARRMDLLAYQRDEIRVARLRVGEDEELLRERDLLANAEERTEAAATAHSLLAEGEGEGRSAIDLLGEAVSRIADLAELDESTRAQQEEAETALFQLEELARALRRYGEEVELDPGRQEVVEERLATIQALKRKYGDTIPDILVFADRVEADLKRVSRSEEEAEDLQAEEASLLVTMADVGQDLSHRRHAAASELEGEIERELRVLAMPDARFYVGMHWADDAQGVEIEGRRHGFDDSGLDQVGFLFAPNPGEERKPLARIASGGEMSRLMLALKTVLSQADVVPTLIFDEIDAGIGGRTGQTVGDKLVGLAKSHQVLCITHLGQIAARGTRHFRVSKHVSEGRTRSVVRLLASEERVDEIAVMVGGRITEATRHSARELLRDTSSLAAKERETA